MDSGILKRLIAPPSLSWAEFGKLAKGVFVEDLPPRATLFREGSRDNNIVYLLEGEVELSTFSGGRQGTIRGGSLETRCPIAEEQPRVFTGRAISQVTVIQFERSKLDALGTVHDLSQIEVAEILDWASEGDSGEDSAETDADWMSRLLHLPAFVHLPPVSIQALYSRLEPISVKDGQVIVEQGVPGTEYFIVMKGRCTVTRTNALGAMVVLAHLAEGDAFGEQSLVSGEPRMATVTMDSDGQLLRLSEPDFEEFIKQHMLRELSLPEAVSMVKRGARFLDVRLRKEHTEWHLDNSQNIPLFLLRLKRESLDPAATYVCYCNDGRTSAVATFLLREWGVDVYLISGGLPSRMSIDSCDESAPDLPVP